SIYIIPYSASALVSLFSVLFHFFLSSQSPHVTH
ncbi:hypothetical protein D046_1939B, partial [Vibrio parahaemolyticus V-223/04]